MGLTRKRGLSALLKPVKDADTDGNTINPDDTVAKADVPPELPRQYLQDILLRVRERVRAVEASAGVISVPNSSNGNGEN